MSPVDKCQQTLVPKNIKTFTKMFDWKPAKYTVNATPFPICKYSSCRKEGQIQLNVKQSRRGEKSMVERNGGKEV